MRNSTSLDTLCAALCYALGIEPPKEAAAPNADLCAYIDTQLNGKKADRIFMYNPDAVAQWIFQKYPHFLNEVTGRTELQLPLCTVMPSVTPVCFGTMYTGAQPAVHGIQKYEKPVIKIDTIFDALLQAGKKPALVSTAKDSMGNIYLERDMDYYLYDSIEKVNAKATQLILEDKHDFICVYNGNYDTCMHKTGPESVDSLGELRTNARTFGMYYEMIAEHWGKHNALIGFAMDHGCHEIDGDCGSHGLDTDEDMNITHFYKVLPKVEE